jgi:hypothetical protein
MENLARGCSDKGRRQRSRSSEKDSSSYGPVAPTRVTHEAWESGHSFQDHCSDATKREVEDVEATMCTQTLTTPNNHILEETHDWVTDPFYSRTRDIKYFKVLEKYWIVKAMVGQALEKSMEERRDIMHSIRIFEGKFELLYHIVVWDQIQSVPFMQAHGH